MHDARKTRRTNLEDCLYISWCALDLGHMIATQRPGLHPALRLPGVVVVLATHEGELGQNQAAVNVPQITSLRSKLLGEAHHDRACVSLNLYLWDSDRGLGPSSGWQATLSVGQKLLDPVWGRPDALHSMHSTHHIHCSHAEMRDPHTWSQVGHML